MKLLSLLFLLAPLSAQTPGTVTRTSLNVVSAVAGTINCSFTNQVPALPTGVSMTCHAGAATLVQTSVVPVGDVSGVIGSFASNADNVTWVLTQPVAGTINWQIAANGASQSGTM